jgi:hypothetical protein
MSGTVCIVQLASSIYDPFGTTINWISSIYDPFRIIRLVGMYMACFRFSMIYLVNLALLIAIVIVQRHFIGEFISQPSTHPWVI